MMEKLLTIEKILYKRKTIDEGIILGSRPYRWTLRPKYSPCMAKEGTAKISVETPHKTNFQVYIPASELSPGKQIFIVSREYLQPKKTTLLEIKEIGQGFCVAEILEEQEEAINEPLKERAWMNLSQEEIDAFNAKLEEPVFGEFQKKREKTSRTEAEEEDVDTSFHFGANVQEAEKEEEKQATPNTQQQKTWLNIVVNCALRAVDRVVSQKIHEYTHQNKRKRSIFPP